MAKKNSGALRTLLGFLAWLTGVVVSLSVGFAMIDNILSLPSYLGGTSVAMVAGWIVVITTVVSIVLAIVHRFS